MPQSIIYILITSAALHSYVAHPAAKLQFEQVNLTETTQTFRHNNNNDNNNNYNDDNANYNQLDAIIIGNRNVGKKQNENDVLSETKPKPKPLLQVKVSNEVESFAERNSNMSSLEMPQTTSSSSSTLMSQSMPLIQRHRFGQPHRQFGNNNSLNPTGTLKGVDVVVTQQQQQQPTSAASAVGDEQLLRLQDYNLLFNAERHTYFQLHTNLTANKLKRNAGMMAMSSVGIKRRRQQQQQQQQRRRRGRELDEQQRSLYNIVGDTLNAAFGFNAGHNNNNNNNMPGKTDKAELQVEMLQLYDAIRLRQTRFNPFKPTRILIHGWLGSANANMYAALVPAYLQQLHTGDYNIITVDWGRGALADYITASYRVKPVGKVLAKFIDFLHIEAGMRFEDLQLIGFSMGAHIAGIAGKHVQTGRLRVIRALDPALPFFRYAGEAERLARSDAAYVEVLHTSVGSYGFDRPLGHVDFYANWGSSQPGCFWNECSHWRAFQLFAESLMMKKRGGKFMAQGCAPEDWQQLTRQKRCPHRIERQLSMGGDLTHVQTATLLDLTVRHGVYYFQTNANAPYAMQR